jgi:hypothetical protein
VADNPADLFNVAPIPGACVTSTPPEASLVPGCFANARPPARPVLLIAATQRPLAASAGRDVRHPGLKTIRPGP